MSTVHRIRLIRSPLGSGKEDPSDDEHPQVEAHDATLFDNPQFQHYEETSNIQLFFDLFFVANLTSFTNVHEVNSLSKLASYIGFFCILWFTWCQVTMYDVRFSTDSIFERLAHICHFGVMVGLAVIGPNFEDPREAQWSTLQQLSLILMASRAVLFLQYTSTLFFSWKYRTTRVPLMGVLTSLAIAVILYLGLSFAFSTMASEHAYLAWYVIAVFEVGANIAIAGRWHVVSFKGTHLTERMTCLTLIILGEGVIGLTKSITKIENLDFNFSASTIGTLISALLVIYFIYQLYFDNVQLEHFGIIRQQIWTFLHFPFHMALVLLMEGTNQFVSWRHVIEYTNNILAPLDNPDPNQSADLYLLAVNNTINSVLNNAFLGVTEDTYLEVTNDFKNITSNPNLTDDQATELATTILVDLLKLIFNGYGFEPPESETEGQDIDTVFNAYYSVFELVFGYFFISAGLVLIFLGVLSWLSHSKGLHESRSHLGGIISKFVIGLGLVLCSIMVLTQSADNLGESAWTLPLLFFLLAIALILNHIPWSDFNRSRTHDLPTNSIGRQKKLPWGFLTKSVSRKRSQ